MISANISKETRKAVYRRDGWRCALCDSTKTIQIHHYIPRSRGGTNSPQNLITLCSDCHALAHGHNIAGWVDVDQDDIQQKIVEYLADTYAGEWEEYEE
jgi:5-methylcytosine-specific restriction endonuclease McrA